MEKSFTFYARAVACTVLTFSLLFISSFTAKTYAQISCPNESVLFSDTFGTGTTATTDANVVPATLTFQLDGPLGNEGTYRVANNAQQKPEWHASEDHTTGDVNGKMLVINGTTGDFYIHQTDRPNGFVVGTYIVGFYAMNIDTLGTCGANALSALISFRVEYLSSTNTWVPLTGSPYAAPAVGQTAAATWKSVASSFILPPTAALVKSIRVVLSDGTTGGCGNDFAIDDVKFSFCPEGGPLPVEFLGINARQKGSGVSVEWSTSQEMNSKSFVVEKSADGSNSNWNVVATVNAAGNSSTVKNYNAFDAQPFKGINFYRIRQVDKDGNFKYSKIVSLKVNFTTTGVTVITNPFHNSLTVDVSSASQQVLSARLVDITGKQVGFEKWSINTGTTRKDFSNVSGLQQGMYILTVSGAGGEILYNNKVIKQ